ncbi:MAG: ribosome maturation factor RimP [Eubacteriales bacterium]|nr:ribosome maturation factor RimP [Eubacteriales bacterium]
MAGNKKKGTAREVWELVQPIVEGFDLTLWDVRYEKEGSQWFLRVFIDKEDGVDINDCENVSRAIDKPLDELDPITDNYILEVSSPGIERELVLDTHFEQFIGADIMVKMIRPIEGIGKEFKGVLKAYDKGEVTIADHSDENEVVIAKKDAAYIKLDDFDI